MSLIRKCPLLSTVCVLVGYPQLALLYIISLPHYLHWDEITFMWGLFIVLAILYTGIADIKIIKVIVLQHCVYNEGSTVHNST